jgi:hypothetical protein
MPLETDANGMVITRPVLGWTTVTVAESSVILQMQYAETPQELKTGGRSIQFVLTPPQCLELAETLTKQANRILTVTTSGPPN